MALMVSGLAMTAALSAAAELRREARRTSHQQPVEEHWFEPTAATSPELIAKGRALFLDSCAHCHAADATGDEGPDLHGVQVSDRYIATIVTRGIKGEMPSFQKKLRGEDIKALTGYLRSLK